MRKIFTLFLPFIFFFCSCSQSSQEAEPIVFVTILVYKPLVTELCKGVAKVEAIIPPFSDIHFFEPKPSDVKELTKGVIWFGIGELFEKKLLGSLQNKKEITYVNLSDHIKTLSISGAPCSHNHDHDHHHDHHHDELSRDLHIWMSPVSMIEQIHVMQEYLIKQFPEKKELLQANANLVIEKLSSLNKEIQKILAPHSGSSVLLSHPALGYFCETYKLNQISIECEGKSPSPKDLEKLLKKLQHTKIQCAFSQRGFPNQAAEKISATLHFPLYELDPYDIHYEENLLKIATQIAQ
jgi:zinc transport system substrate-binding protein